MRNSELCEADQIDPAERVIRVQKIADRVFSGLMPCENSWAPPESEWDVDPTE